MSSYLGKKINVTLLLFIVAFILAFIGVTIFFQKGLTICTGGFAETSSQLSVCEMQVQNYEARVLKAEDRAETSSKDVDKYDELYDVKTEELRKSEAEVAEKNKIILTQENTISMLKINEAYMVRTMNSLNATIIERDAQIKNLRRDIYNLNEQLSACG